MAKTITLAPGDLQLPSFYRWEKSQPEKLFLTQPVGGGAVENLTWRQAGDEARRMATWLVEQGKAHGWEKGSTVAILGKNSAHWILADLAIWMAGYVSVPIYPTFNGQALRYILEHSGAKVCFVGKLDEVSALKDGVPEGVQMIALPLAPASLKTTTWKSLIANSKPMAGEPQRDGEELCTVIYTSGTTGNPKGVMHKFNAMAWGLKTATAPGRVQLQATDRYLSYLPLAHIAERMLIEQGALVNGGHIFFAESLDTFAQDLQRAQPTIFFSVPRLWVKFQHGVFAKFPPKKLNLLLSLPIIGGIVRKKILSGLGLGNCRLAAGGAAPMPPDVLRWYRDLGLDLIEVYGMTENSGVSHATLPGTFKPGTVGLPYDGVGSRIDAETGEIQMKAPCLMMGYYKDPAQTASALTADGWLHTGDKGRLEPDGCLKITGRVKDLFKTSKGKYVAPAPIEELLVNSPDVEACAATGANFAQPFAIVMLSPDALQRAATAEGKAAIEKSMSDHLAQVNAKLEAHEKLDFLAIVKTTWSPENGFVTPTFKVKRNKIEEAYESQYAGWLAQKKSVVWA
ncbi:MAG: AMP-binding protein [Burkholderiaceae bacterium]|nr:AMP-binding protein [Burkholderiaceae bacterium]